MDPGVPFSLAGMHPLQVYAWAVGTVMIVIALAQWLASYRVDRRALRLFAVHYASAGLGWYFAHPQAHASDESAAPFLSMVVAVALLTLLLVALLEFVGLGQRRRTGVVVTLGAAVVAALWALHRAAPDSALGIYAVMTLTTGGCALISWRAAVREPGVGLGWVGAAFASYPLLMLAPTVFGLVPSDVHVGYWVALPTSVAGMAVLVVGVRRAALRTDDELQRRREAEDALRRLNSTLEQRVADRTAQLQLITDGLEAFTRSVSHDLRGSLSGLGGVVRMAQSALADGDVERARSLLDPVAPELDHLLALVRRLLEWSRADRVELALQSQPLAPLARRAVDQLALDPEHGPLLARVTVAIDELPTWPADATLMRQVFVNLIGNALRFAGADGRAPRVHVGSRVVDGVPAVYVDDNGHGFDDRQAASLFTPLQRLHGDGLSRHGIGLSIVRRIVERHGGRVWAEGRPGAGATFWFTLGRAA